MLILTLFYLTHLVTQHIFKEHHNEMIDPNHLSIQEEIGEGEFRYRIMQIVRSGKLSWLQRLVEICGKTFVVVSFMQYIID